MSLDPGHQPHLDSLQRLGIVLESERLVLVVDEHLPEPDDEDDLLPERDVLVMAMATVCKSLSDIVSRQILLLELAELVVLLDVLFVVEGVLDVENRVVVLQQTEKKLVLLVLDRVVADVEMDQVLILSLGEHTGELSESLGIDLAVPQPQLLDRTILVNHDTQLVN